MFNIQYRNGDQIITDKLQDRVPLKGEGIAFFSYNNQLEEKEMHINEYYVVHTISMIRDPAPPKDFIAVGVGDERHIIFLQPKADYEAAMKKQFSAVKPPVDEPPTPAQN